MAWVATEGYVLEPRQRRELLVYEVTGAPRGVPRYFSVNSDALGELQLWIAPLSSSTSRVMKYSYVKKPAAMTLTTDTLDVPDRLSEAVVIRCVYLVAVRKGDANLAALAAADYDRTMLHLRDESMTSRGPYRPRTRNDWG